MSDYLTSEQIAQLLRGINPKRVGTDGKGFSHVEAYEIRAHLNRLFGFGRWSADVLDQTLVYEDGAEKSKNNGGTYTAWSVCYRSLLRLTVCSPDGTVLATYTEGATGEAKNQPSRGDAHDLALKTSESQALKRAAFNLGDQFGLSLFGGGATAALVRRTLVMPDAAPSEDAVDSHITEQLPREGETAEPAEDPRSTNQTPAAPPVAAGPVEGGAPPVASPSTPEQSDEEAQRIRELALGKPGQGYSAHRWIAHLMGEAVKRGVLQTQVESSLSPTKVALKVFLEECLKAATDRERQARAS